MAETGKLGGARGLELGHRRLERCIFGQASKHPEWDLSFFILLAKTRAEQAKMIALCLRSPFEHLKLAQTGSMSCVRHLSKSLNPASCEGSTQWTSNIRFTIPSKHRMPFNSHTELRPRQAVHFLMFPILCGAFLCTSVVFLVALANTPSSFVIPRRAHEVGSPALVKLVEEQTSSLSFTRPILRWRTRCKTLGDD